MEDAYDREQATWARMTSTISVGAAIGVTVGTVAGAGNRVRSGRYRGCHRDRGVAGGSVRALRDGPFCDGRAVIGCLGGIVALGALGTAFGTLLVTAPIAIAGAVQYFITINAPFRAPAKQPVRIHEAAPLSGLRDT